MNIRRIPESRVGEKINEWEIISFDRKVKKFVLKCKCGFEKKDYLSNIIKQKTCHLCRCKEFSLEYVGKTYDKLTVIDSIYTDGRNKLKVRCQCGNEYIICPYQLKYTRGCCKCKHDMYPGKVIDGMTIMEYLGKRKYKIKCICGNIFESIPRKYKGKYSTCGCNKRSKLIEDAKKFIGTKYENFIVKKVLGILEGHVIFELKCRCGKIILRKNGQIYKSKSCGCLNNQSIPHGERTSKAKLKNVEVIAMRELYDSGQYDTQKLMEMYDLPYSYVKRIITRKIWKNV